MTEKELNDEAINERTKVLNMELTIHDKLILLKEIDRQLAIDIEALHG